MTASTAGRLAAHLAGAVLLLGLAACHPADDDAGPATQGGTSPSAADDGWDMDWSTPHTRPGEPVTGSVDLETQAVALGARDTLDEDVPGHPGWTRVTVRRAPGAAPVPATTGHPGFDFERLCQYGPFTTSDGTPTPTRVTGPRGSTVTNVFTRDGRAVVCVSFQAAGSGLLTNARLGLAFSAPADQGAALQDYVRGLAVTDPSTHDRTDSPRVRVELGYLGTRCAGDDAALARCPSGEAPRQRDENWGPGYDLSAFTPTGKTPQGYDYQLRKVQYTQCTNECHEEPAVQLFVRVPANAHGTHPELFLIWSEHTDDDAHLRGRANRLTVRT